MVRSLPLLAWSVSRSPRWHPSYRWWPYCPPPLWKVAQLSVSEEISAHLHPLQLGVGVPSGLRLLCTPLKAMSHSTNLGFTSHSQHVRRCIVKNTCKYLVNACGNNVKIYSWPIKRTFRLLTATNEVIGAVRLPKALTLSDYVIRER